MTKKQALKKIKEIYSSAYRYKRCEYTGEITVFCRKPEGKYGLTTITITSMEDEDDNVK